MSAQEELELFQSAELLQELGFDAHICSAQTCSEQLGTELDFGGYFRPDEGVLTPSTLFSALLSELNEVEIFPCTALLETQRSMNGQEEEDLMFGEFASAQLLVAQPPCEDSDCDEDHGELATEEDVEALVLPPAQLRALLVAEADLGGGEAGAALGPPPDDLVTLVEQALVEELRQRPPPQ